MLPDLQHHSLIRDSIILTQQEQTIVIKKIHPKYGEVCQIIHKWPRIQKNFTQQELQKVIKDKFAIQHQYFEINRILMKSQHILQANDIQVISNGILWIEEKFQNTLSQVDHYQLSYSKKLQIIDSIAKAVLHLTKNQICHRNINPDSICITLQSQKEITAKLRNFRSVFVLNKRIKQRYQGINKRKLNPSIYIAPEIQSEKAETSKSDVWSLGVIFYELIFGTTSGIKIRSQSVQLYFPQKAPTWMVSILKGILTLTPNERYDINHFISILKQAFVCSQATEKCLAEIGLCQMKKTNSSDTISL